MWHSQLGVVVLSVLSVCSSAVAYRSSKCDRCKKLVDGFREGEKRTARFNFGGGDVHWEERKKISYLKSETRLVEIVESSCEKSNHECTSFLEEYEEFLEAWWFKKQDKFPDLEDWLCRIRAKVCCRKNEYGKNCTPCPGGVENPCGGFGECQGAGDRRGSGKCHCRHGYTGKLCDACEAGFFNETKINMCLECHSACLLNCTGALEEHCLDCDPGWRKLDTGGCRDVDECVTAVTGMKHNCETNQYCANVPGSFMCEECDKSCASCTGVGPRNCASCAQGFRANSNEDDVYLCDDVDECKDGVEDGSSEGSSGDDGDAASTPQDTARASACDAATETCYNTFGSFGCVCKRGYQRQGTACVEDPDYREPTPSDEQEHAEEIADDGTGEAAATLSGDGDAGALPLPGDGGDALQDQPLPEATDVPAEHTSEQVDTREEL